MAQTAIFDELNLLRTDIVETIRSMSTVSENGQITLNTGECVDAVLDALIIAYMYGDTAVKDMLGDRYIPSTNKETASGMKDTLYRPVAGKTFEERVKEYASAGDLESIVRVAETEITRVFCDSELRSAKKSNAETKTWKTMEDERVRDTHSYLQGVTIPIDAEFYTFDGDKALAPEGFSLVENNANCRCVLEFN